MLEMSTIIDALCCHKESLGWNGTPMSPKEALELLETSDALSIQDFCTENPKVGSDDLVWEGLFEHQFPGLYPPFFEVFTAYRASEGTEDAQLPLSTHMTERVPMFWRDCWQSLLVLPETAIATVEHLANGECKAVDLSPYFADVALICESHWTLAVVLGSMDSSCRCVVPVILCCAPELLSSVFFCEESIEKRTFSLLSDGKVLTERGAYFLLDHRHLIYDLSREIVAYCIQRGFKSDVPRLIEVSRRFGSIFHSAADSGQEEIALMIARDMGADLINSSHLIAAAGAGLQGLVSFLLEQKGPALLEREPKYCRAVTNSIDGSHPEVFRTLMEYAEPKFWINQSLGFDLIHNAIKCAAESGSRAQMLDTLLRSGYHPEAMTNIITCWIRTGDVDCVRLLLADGRAHPSSGGHSSINMAAQMGNTEMLELILEDGRENLAMCLKGRHNPFLLTEVQERIDLFTLLLTYLVRDSTTLSSVVNCAINSHNIEFVRVLLKYVPDLGIESDFHSLVLLLQKDEARMLRLMLTNMTLDADAPSVLLSELLRFAVENSAYECFLLILEIGGPLMNCDAALDSALAVNGHKVVRLLLDDGRANPMHAGAHLMLDSLASGAKESLDLLLRDERVKNELPMIDMALLFICTEGGAENELINEYLDKTIENLKAGGIELNMDLTRLQLKELARRMGHAVHAGMGREDLMSLISPKWKSGFE